MWGKFCGFSCQRGLGEGCALEISLYTTDQNEGLDQRDRGHSQVRLHARDTVFMLSNIDRQKVRDRCPHYPPLAWRMWRADAFYFLRLPAPIRGEKAPPRELVKLAAAR